MIVNCPNCLTRFTLDAKALVPSGRRVKCRRCGHLWHQDPASQAELEAEAAAFVPPPPNWEPPPDEAQASDDGQEAAFAPEPEWTPDLVAPQHLAAQSPPAGLTLSAGRRPRRAIWLIVLMLIVGAGGAAYWGREYVMQAAPGVGDLLALIFASPDPAGVGLALGKLESERRREGGVPILVIRGEIANSSVEPREVPQLKGSLYGADGQVLQSWRFTAPEAKLLAGATVRFETEVRNPPAKATDLKISFVAE